MPITAGSLDRKIIIQRATVTKNALNEDVEAWSSLARVSASKHDVSDSERVSSQEVGAEITTRFQIRWASTVSDVSPKDRVLYDSRIYSIVAVKEIGRREGVEITASARADRLDG